MRIPSYGIVDASADSDDAVSADSSEDALQISTLPFSDSDGEEEKYDVEAADSYGPDDEYNPDEEFDIPSHLR
jgi:hypothetical protein